MVKEVSDEDADDLTWATAWSSLMTVKIEIC